MHEICENSDALFHHFFVSCKRKRMTTPTLMRCNELLYAFSVISLKGARDFPGKAHAALKVIALRQQT